MLLMFTLAPTPAVPAVSTAVAVELLAMWAATVLAAIVVMSVFPMLARALVVLAELTLRALRRLLLLLLLSRL